MFLEAINILHPLRRGLRTKLNRSRDVPAREPRQESRALQEPCTCDRECFGHASRACGHLAARPTSETFAPVEHGTRPRMHRDLDRGHVDERAMPHVFQLAASRIVRGLSDRARIHVLTQCHKANVQEHRTFARVMGGIVPVLRMHEDKVGNIASARSRSPPGNKPSSWKCCATTLGPSPTTT